MSKQDPYRFNLRFDETDEDHRKVSEFLNACGRKKTRYIVKAFQAYWGINGEGIPKRLQIAADEVTEVKPEMVEDERHLVNVDMTDYSADEAEVSLMRKNYQMFDSLGEEM